MERILKWIEAKFLPPMAALSEEIHLRAIRDGVISTLPLIIVGSFFLIIAQPPVASWALAIKPYVPQIMIPYRMTMGLMSLYAAYGMGYSLSKSYKLDGVSGGVLSLAAFLLVTTPVNLDTVLAEATKAGVQGAAPIGWVLPMTNLGGSGLFAAMICMIFAVETLRILKKYNCTFKMPEQVPESVARSFEALIPAAVIITVIWFVRVWLNFDIQTEIMNLFKPIISVTGNSLGGVLVPVLCIALLWTTGIHGDSIIGSLVRPIWLVLLDQNTAAVAAGKIIPNIAPEPFIQWFIWIGGSGATLSLALLMCFSKSEYLKKVGRFSIVPGIFNINEPLIFGAPIVMNPILAIPFILSPIINTIVAYGATTFGLVSKVYILAPWTLPAPIGAYVATGGDWRAIILVIFNITLATFIYYPFFKAYEKKMLAEEQSLVSSKSVVLTD